MKFIKKVLESGLRVIVVPMKDNPTVTVLIMVEAGSKYETKNVTGLSHFLEHMCFKGTDKRPTAKDISGELDAVGSHYNAFTSQEYTGYYAKAEARHFEKLLDVVSDIYLHPKLPDTEIQKEKGVIIEEINLYEDMPHRHVHDLYMEVLYGDQPAGWSIAGTRESVKAMKRDDFVQYREKQYVAEATAVIIAGNVEEKKVFEDVGKAFAKISRQTKNEKVPVSEIQEKPKAKVQFKKTDQSHLILGVRSFPIGDKRHIILKVMENVLSGGMSSRLFQRLREEMGVCYYVRAFEDSYTDHGTMAIAAGVTTARIEEVIKVLLEEFKKLKDHKVSAAELRKVKDYMIGTMYLGLESSDSIAEFYGYQEVLHERVETPEEIIKKIEAVTADDIQAVANEIFQNDRLNFALIGPFEDSAPFEKLLSLN